MTRHDVASMAAPTLDKCDELVAELHEQCCEPNRSPRMLALAETLSSVRNDLTKLNDDPDTAERLIDRLEGAGAEIGRLQIACCAPGRMPLYSKLLSGLSHTQRMITAATGGTDH